MRIRGLVSSFTSIAAVVRKRVGAAGIRSIKRIKYLKRKIIEMGLKTGSASTS